MLHACGFLRINGHSGNVWKTSCKHDSRLVLRWQPHAVPSIKADALLGVLG